MMTGEQGKVVLFNDDPETGQGQYYLMMTGPRSVLLNGDWETGHGPYYLLMSVKLGNNDI